MSASESTATQSAGSTALQYLAGFLWRVAYVLISSMELYLAYTHTQVLLGYEGIADVSLEMRKIYFSVDMALALLTFSLTRRNHWMTLVHFVVHSTAVLHLLGVWETHFYREVYRLAELHPSTALITTIYSVLTAEDILLHVLNAAGMWRDVLSVPQPADRVKDRNSARGKAGAKVAPAPKLD